MVRGIVRVSQQALLFYKKAAKNFWAFGPWVLMLSVHMTQRSKKLVLFRESRVQFYLSKHFATIR
jgi:hypothetical protein